MKIFASMAEAAEQGDPFVVATVISTGGSTPQKSGAKMLVRADGSIAGTVGGGSVEHQVVNAAKALLAQTERETELVDVHLTQEQGACCGGRMSVFLERFGGSDRLYVFGAGHVGRALAQLAARLGFGVTVVDERDAWLSAERFPDARRVLAHPPDAAKSLPFNERTFVAIATHDHSLDQKVLEVALRRPAAYVGMIGSRSKGERFRKGLEAAGFSAQEIARLRTPMGLPISAQGPDEIAVSIAAELVAVRRGDAAASVRKKQG